MANIKRNVYKPKPMTVGKKNLIQGLLQEYEIESAPPSLIQNSVLTFWIFAIITTPIRSYVAWEKITCLPKEN